MLKSKNLFSISNESNEEDSGKPMSELSEQGSVSNTDGEDVVASVTVEDDVVEAGDNIGQGTPKDQITPDSKIDITQSATPNETSEVEELLEDGKQAVEAKQAIIDTAVSEVSGVETEGPAAGIDENGNALTEEQAEVNHEEEKVEQEVEEEAKEEAKAKNIHQEAKEADENSDEELIDAINDDSPDGDLGSDADESVDVSQDADTFGGNDGPSEGDDSGDMGIDADLNDDTPLEGSETEESENGNTNLDSDSTTGSDTSNEVDSEDLSVVADESEETTTEDETGGEQVDSTDDVDEAIVDQNAAAEVTDEATGSADAEAAGDGSNIEGEETMSEETPTEVTEEIDGPKVNKYGDVESEEEQIDNNSEPVPNEVVIEETDLEDDTPLEGAEPLDVDVEEPLTPSGRDMGDSDGTAATVEESVTDQTAEDLQDGVDAVADATDEIEEDSGTVDTTTDEGQPDAIISEPTGDIDDTADVNAAINPEVGPDIDGGEIIVDSDTEANFDEGEVDIKDVDLDTTDEEVEEAMADAAEVGEWGDQEAKEADDADKTIEELQKEEATLEQYRVLLEDGIANESYNRGLLSWMNASVEPLRRYLVKLDSIVGTTTAEKVSVESFGRDVDLAYVATLESFRGMISRIVTINTGLAHRLEKMWSRSLVDKVTTRADALDKQIDLQLVKLKDSSYTTGVVKGVRGYLSTDETNLLKAVANDLGLTTDIAIKGIKASEQLQLAVIKAVNDIIGAGSEEDISKVLDALVSLKSTKTSFPNAVFDKGLLGGWKLEFREGKGSDRAEKIEALGHTGIPVGVKTKEKSEVAEFTLTKGDLANLLKFAKTYVGVARKLASTTGDRAIGMAAKVRTTRTRALPLVADTRIRGDESGVDAAATAMKLLAQSHLDLYKFITSHCVEVADALCGIAKKAIK